MKRLWWALPVLLIAFVAAVPGIARRAAEDRGVTVGSVGWCGDGLCLRDIRRGGVTATSGTLGFDRQLRLRDVHVERGEAGTETGGVPTKLPLKKVRVENLVVEGLPVPPLRGEVWPHRRLTGEGVRIDGDVVDAEMQTEFGKVIGTVRKDGDTLALVADCTCTITIEALSPDPLRDHKVHADGSYVDGTFTGAVTVDGVEAQVTAKRSQDGAINAEFNVREAPIAAVYALFQEVVPEVANATIRGKVSATGTVRWPEVELVVHPKIDNFAVDGLVGPEYRVGSFSYPVLDRAGNRTVRTTGDGTQDWLPLPAMGPYLPAAVIAAEDGRFPSHPGYDVDGMLDAARENRESGKIERGGSTLTQQLAKNLFLDGSRTYQRKLRELLYAVELERELGKSRILEVYLNAVEFGPGVYGARAAARAFFSKSPPGLLPEEAAFLAAILRNPRTAWQTQYQRGSAYRGRVDWILENMRIDPTEREAAKAREIVLVPGG